MLSHASPDPKSARVWGNHEGGIGDVRAGSGLIWSQNIRADYASIVFCNISARGRSKPISQRLFTRHPGIKCIRVASGDNLIKNIPDRLAFPLPFWTNFHLTPNKGYKFFGRAPPAISEASCWANSPLTAIRGLQYLRRGGRGLWPFPSLCWPSTH